MPQNVKHFLKAVQYLLASFIFIDLVFFVISNTYFVTHLTKFKFADSNSISCLGITLNVYP